MRRPRGVVLATVVIALTLPAVGCGDDDGDKPTGLDSDTVAKADFVQAANTACVRRLKEIEAGVKPLYAKIESDPSVQDRIIKAVVAPGFEGEIKDIRAVAPPPGEEQQVEDLLEAMESMVARLREGFDSNWRYPYRKTENLAAALGLPDCGHP